MTRSVVTRIMVASVLGTSVLSAFRTPDRDAETRIADKRADHAVINVAINDIINPTSPKALAGIVVVDSTIPALKDDSLMEKKSKFMQTFFMSHAQLGTMPAKDLLKDKPRMKLERILFDTRTKMEFASTSSLLQMGIPIDTPNDSAWRVFHAKYPQASGLLAFSVPGYDESRDLALVSYYLLCGNGCFQKGYVLAERNQTNNTWRRIHRAVTFGGG